MACHMVLYDNIIEMKSRFHFELIILLCLHPNRLEAFIFSPIRLVVGLSIHLGCISAAITGESLNGLS